MINHFHSCAKMCKYYGLLTRLPSMRWLQPITYVSNIAPNLKPIRFIRLEITSVNIPPPPFFYHLGCIFAPCTRNKLSVSKTHALQMMFFFKFREVESLICTYIQIHCSLMTVYKQAILLCLWCSECACFCLFLLFCGRSPG